MNIQLFNIRPLILIGLVILTSMGCQKDTKEPIHELQIHLQGGFDNDKVEVKLDNESVFEENITTNNVLGVATVFPAAVNQGSHTLEIFTNGENALFAFTVKEELSVGINYDWEKKEISAIYSNTGFAYD